VEFAVVLPVMLLLVFGIVDFGLVLHQRGLIGNAARDGARVGVVKPVSTMVTDIRNAAWNASNIKNASTVVTVTPSCTKTVGTCTLNNDPVTGVVAGDTIVVNVRYTYTFITPVAAVFSKTMLVESTARMRYEGT
jgi:Flp pilus assembly protein TadG